MSSLYDTLQAEFCPPLDTSLLAALIADLDSSPPPGQVDALRRTLKELANQATAQYEHELADELDSSNLSSLCRTTDDSNSSPDLYGETTETSATSDSSAISYQSFSSPIGFLQAALPHVPLSQLQRALSKAGAGNEGDVDMESVVETILTSEFIHELEERGLDALDDDLRSPDDDLPWKCVEAKKKPTLNGKASKKKNTRRKTITLVDIRQQQHQQPSTPSRTLAPDPWTQLASLSEHLATLLPPHTPSFFQSHFHSPAYSSPSKALRTALSSVAGTQSDSSSEATTTLFTMLDVLRDSPAYASLDTEQRSTLYSDAQLALRATHGCGDDAIDVVWLLLELDLDLESGTLAMGVYHSQSPLSPSSSSAWSSPSAPSSPPLPARRDRSSSTSRAVRQLPSGPPPVLPPPTSKRKSMSSASSTSISPTTTKPHPFQWQTVPEKPPKGPHPLALHIPAYDSTNQSRRSAVGKGNGLRKGGKGDVGELSRPDLRQRMAASLRKRDELLREASKAWSRGNAKTRGWGSRAVFCRTSARVSRIGTTRGAQRSTAHGRVETFGICRPPHQSISTVPLSPKPSSSSRTSSMTKGVLPRLR
ncbi:hypothetical protein JVU11DRAFT_9937 [Chiua virens]|nr:hypothetical protein JVU11DRAFT_9937 [Chiua virens]